MDLVQHALDPSTTVMMWNAVTSESGKPFIIPIVGLLIGAAMMAAPATNTVGKLVLYFGAQSFMNIYMGWVMRTSVTVPAGTFIARTNSTLESDLTGCPAGFALTAMQQVISFVIFWIFFSGAYFTPYRYTPKKLTGMFEVFCVIVFGCVFALNIALNNFSLGYISIAVNLIIRSCLPLTTFLSQQGLAVFKLYPFKPCRPKEILLMIVGVACPAGPRGVQALPLQTLPAEGDTPHDRRRRVRRGLHNGGIMGSASQGKGSSNMVLGVCMCVASLLCGSLNLALAGVLGETKLNVFDTVAYMAIPATLFLLPIAMFLQKPVPGEWPKVFGVTHMSDWEILQGVWALNKRTMAWLVLSGIFSFIYNIIQFSIVHTLSPSATAFGGNFNKAALIFLTLLLPFLRVHELPGPPYIQVIWGAVIVNIAAFSYYSYLQIQAKQDANKQHQAELLDESDEEEGEPTGTGSSASGSTGSE
eukprot:CAMPEP_0198615480 /NCGR_PEP_ID=MMETSP1462-20131121/159412_1 /TAXON_ID=1333877 /ORGANISM="Brandtodinium nutriculum, Strain RCC3387" /LENGTH=472 /DNA_ID=CAMNT_0044347279 /DNA_START=70 /DNA_END=1486 /DNA_ORIENTATION=+